MRETFERDGFVVLEGALSRVETERLLRAVDAVHARSDRAEPLHDLGFVGRDPRFLHLVAHRATLPLVTDVLGWNIYCYHCHLDVHPPSDEAPRWRWHQDGGRQNAELESPRPRLSMKVAYFLTHVPTPEHGPLWVVRGSHRRDTLPRPADGAVRPPDAEPLLVRAGTAVIFDRRLWHARGDNRSTQTRKALFYAYTYRWIRPRDDLHLDETALEGLDPIRRQLLGAGTGAIGYWIPQADDVPLREVRVL